MSAHPNPLGDRISDFPRSRKTLLIDADGNPQRIDKAFSWDAPFASHGLMHMVINNAFKRDPYPIDVLFMYMANMSWNSSMNVPDTIKSLTGKDDRTGEYVIPKIIYSDAYYSEMVPYADLILPDTTYPRAMGLYLDAGSADFRAECRRGLDPSAGGPARTGMSGRFRKF